MWPAVYTLFILLSLQLPFLSFSLNMAWMIVKGLALAGTGLYVPLCFSFLFFVFLFPFLFLKPHLTPTHSLHTPIFLFTMLYPWYQKKGLLLAALGLYFSFLFCSSHHSTCITIHVYFTWIWFIIYFLFLCSSVHMRSSLFALRSSFSSHSQFFSFIALSFLFHYFSAHCNLSSSSVEAWMILIFYAGRH